MSEDFGNDIITISDEEGNDYTLEHFDSLEVDGRFFLACLPADIDEDDDDYGIVILEAVDDDELASVDDEALLEELYEMFMQRLFDEEDEDGGYADD